MACVNFNEVRALMQPGVEVTTLADLLEPPLWHSSAACKGMDPDVFYPSRGSDVRPAKAVCSSCSVREECLEFALDEADKFGIWGGMSERERRRLRRTRAVERRAA